MDQWPLKLAYSPKFILADESDQGSPTWSYDEHEQGMVVLTNSSRGGGAWSSSMRRYRRGGEKPMHGWVEAGSWCLLYRVKIRRGEAVRCRQIVTDSGGSSRQPFRLGRQNKGGNTDLIGEEERSRRHFVSPTHERGRAADGELWHDGVVGQKAAASGGWRSRMTLA
jgi:hypothetical protein